MLNIKSLTQIKHFNSIPRVTLLSWENIYLFLVHNASWGESPWFIYGWAIVPIICFDVIDLNRISALSLSHHASHRKDVPVIKQSQRNVVSGNLQWLLILNNHIRINFPAIFGYLLTYEATNHVDVSFLNLARCESSRIHTGRFQSLLYKSLLLKV